MKTWKKQISLWIGAGLMAMALTGTALAAESRTKITKVDLTIDSDIEAGEDSGDVSVTVTSDTTYTVEEVEIVNDEGEWVSGDVPRVEITLEADDDYYFASMSSSKVKLRGDDATYVSSHREDSSSTLVLTIKLDALEGSMEVEEVNWDGDDSTVAVWEEADGAKSYQVKLYRGSSSVGSTVTTTNTYYNFVSLITREGEYYFKVRGVNSNNKKGDWYESDYIYVDEEMLSKINAGYYNSVSNSSSGTSTTTTTTPSTSTTTSDHWVWDSTAQKWWYSYASGGYPAGGWLLIDGYWYCFDSSGWMMTGWILAGGNYYYCDTSSGKMLTNTTTPDGYRVDANGVWIQ